MKPIKIILLFLLSLCTVVVSAQEETDLKKVRSNARQAMEKCRHETVSGNADSAILYGNQALSHLIQLKDTATMFEIFQHLGENYSRKKNYEQAAANLLAGLQLAEKKKNTLWQGYFHALIAAVYHQTGDFENGIRYGKKAIQMLQNNPRTDKLKLAMAYQALAMNFEQALFPDSALYYYKRIFDKKLNVDTLKIGSVYQNFGQMLYRQNQYKAAESWFIRASKITGLNKSKFSLSEFNNQKINIYLSLIKVYTGLKNQPKTRNYLDSLAKTIDQTGRIENRRDYYELKYAYLKSTGNFSEALKFQELYYQSKDSVARLYSTDACAEVEARYREEKKDFESASNQLTILNAEKEAELRNDIISIVVLILISGIVIFWLNFRNKQIIIRLQRKEFETDSELQQLEASHALLEQRLKIAGFANENTGTRLNSVLSTVNILNQKYKIQNQDFILLMKKIENQTSDTIEELSDSLWAIHADRFYFRDLQNRLQAYVRKVKLQSDQINISFMQDEKLADIELNIAAGINIYKIMQEAIKNALTHSGATNIDVQMENPGENILIRIKDDGRGFNPKTITQGAGLKNMQKRCEDIGGRFYLETGSGRGTKVEVKFGV